MPSTNSSNNSDFASLIDALRRGFWIVALCCLLAGGAAALYALTAPKEYNAVGTMLLGSDSAVTPSLLGEPAAANDPARRTQTVLALVGQRDVAVRTSQRLGGRVTPDEVRGSVIPSVADNSDLITITATDRDPSTAAAMANTFVDQFILLRQDALSKRIEQARRAIERRLDDVRRNGGSDAETIQSLRQRLVDLEFTSTLQGPGVEPAQRAETPMGASSPRVLQTIALGLFGGLLLGLGIALAREQLDRRVRNTKEAQELFSLPVLASVPRSAKFQRWGTLSPVSVSELEPFRMLRTSLRYSEGGETLKSVLVTSPESGTGKTTVAYHYALAEAIAGRRVLLLEADLRHSTLSHRLNLFPAMGLADYLVGDAEAIEPLRQELLIPSEGNGGAAARSLTVLPSGMSRADPLALIESPRMETVLVWASAAFDLVVIDTPPLSVVSDAVPLIGRVDGVLIVSRIGAGAPEPALELLNRLTRLRAHMLGIVTTFGTSESASVYLSDDSRVGRGQGEPVGAREEAIEYGKPAGPQP